MSSMAGSSGDGQSGRARAHTYMFARFPLSLPLSFDR